MKKIAFALLLVLLFASACVPAGNQNAQPISTPTLTIAASILDTPSPEPTINPAIQAALGDPARNYYSVAPDGNAEIIDKETGKSIELSQAQNIKTMNGFDVVIAIDKNDGTRYFYSESYGWVKYIDTKLSSSQNEASIPYSWRMKNADGNTVLNRLLALNYYYAENSDNPPIAKGVDGAVSPYYGINVMQSNDIFISLQAIHSQMDGSSTYGPLKATEFTDKTKPFALMGYFQTVAPDGSIEHILGYINSNPDSNSVISVCLKMDDATFKKYTTTLNSHNIPDLQEFIEQHSKELAIKIDPLKNLSILTTEQQKKIQIIIDLFNAGKDPGQLSVPLGSSLPQEVGTNVWDIKFANWTYPPGK